MVEQALVHKLSHAQKSAKRLLVLNNNGQVIIQIVISDCFHMMQCKIKNNFPYKATYRNVSPAVRHQLTVNEMSDRNRSYRISQAKVCANKFLFRQSNHTEVSSYINTKSDFVNCASM